MPNLFSKSISFFLITFSASPQEKIEVVTKTLFFRLFASIARFPSGVCGCVRLEGLKEIGLNLWEASCVLTFLTVSPIPSDPSRPWDGVGLLRLGMFGVNNVFLGLVTPVSLISLLGRRVGSFLVPSRDITSQHWAMS